MDRSSSIGVLCGLVGAPIAGLLTGAVCDELESAVRSLIGKPALVDDAAIRAAQLIDPLLLILFLGYCSFWIVPIVWTQRNSHASITIGLTVLPPWLLLSFVLHISHLDSPFVTLAAIGYVVAVPILASTLVAMWAIRHVRRAASANDE